MEKKVTETEEPQVQESQVQEVQKMKVHNRNNYKVELMIDNEIVVFPPRKVIEVPQSFVIPSNLGLYKV